MPAKCFKFQDYCYKIEIVLLDHPHRISINISDIVFNMENAISITSQTCDGFNKITIVNCNFTNMILTDRNGDDVEPVAIIDMYFTSCNAVDYARDDRQMNQINILKCYFKNNMNCNTHLTRYIMTIYIRITIHTME